MNLASLKKIYDKLPYAVKAPFAKRLRNQLLKIPVFKETYACLLMSDSIPGLEWSEEKFHEVQESLLSETLSHAYFHTKYYRELFDSLGLPADFTHPFETLKKLPLLTKETLREHLQDIIADDGEGFEVATGGTSGTPTTVMMANEAHYREWAFIYHYWHKFGYDPRTSRLATFRGVKLGNKPYVINPMYNEIRLNIYNLNRDTVEQYVRAMTKFHVDFIYGYPSAVYAFCKLAQEEGIILHGCYKAALLISENLYPHQEEKIREVLGCPIAMFYGHTERAVFAERDKNGGYTFNPLYGITEISDKGEPIVTGFINPKTPLLRYIVDDEVRPTEDGKFDIIGHRNSEVIYGRNGEEFRASSLDFHGSLSEILPNYQFVQNNPGELIVRVLRSDNLSEEDKKKAIDLCRQRLNDDFVVTMEAVDHLAYAESKASRKYRLLCQNIKETE